MRRTVLVTLDIRKRRVGNIGDVVMWIDNLEVKIYFSVGKLVGRDPSVIWGEIVR